MAFPHLKNNLATADSPLKLGLAKTPSVGCPAVNVAV
jgi:hypothetical protein